MVDRRKFVGHSALVAGASALTTRAHGRWPDDADGAAKTVRLGVMGLSRGLALAKELIALPGVEIAFMCDVDQRRVDAGLTQLGAEAKARNKPLPVGTQDFRIILSDQSVDGLVCAAPNHWHGPATVMACKAGKHVYVEKPCSHNPQEGEWMVAAAQKFGRCVQMGTQRRSAPGTQAAIAALHGGEIGSVHSARCYYTNLRASIGRGIDKDPPESLDFDLWQGPVPKQRFRDTYVHYNWHWFWNWGTGEACNNGTHEVDVCRWALGVDYPTRVLSSGGRYHYDDDWEFYDTQVMSFEFEGGKSITWEGRSCNGHQFFDRGRGSTIHGTDGTALVDRDGYIIYDHRGKEVKRNMKGEASDQLNTVGADSLTDHHIANFLNGVREGGELNTPIDEGHKSVLLCHLGNIAQHTGMVLECDPSNGHVYDKKVMESMWGRKYEPGWEMVV